MRMMDQATRKRKRRKGDTRDRVLKSAARLFSTHGYAATSIAAICQASGVLPSSIYWEFGNKAGILAAVLEDAEQRWVEQSTKSVIKAMRGYPETPEGRLDAYFDYMARAITTTPEFARLILMVVLERRHADPHALEIVREQRARSIEALADLFATHGLQSDIIPAMDLARLTNACLDGATAAAQVDRSAEDLQRMFSLLHRAMRAVLQSQDGPSPSE
jgi:AcrR family transcriptional regulator